MDKLTEIRLKKFINDNYYDNSSKCNFYNNYHEPTTNLNEIYMIHLEDTNFTEIPEEIFYFRSLKKLFLYPPIKKLDERLLEINSLKRIIISSNCDIDKNDPIIKKLKNKGVMVTNFNYG